MDKIAAIMVTHDLTYAAEYGDRLLVFNQGEIIFDTRDQENKQEILRDPTYLEKTYGR